MRAGGGFMVEGMVAERKSAAAGTCDSVERFAETFAAEMDKPVEFDVCLSAPVNVYQFFIEFRAHLKVRSRG